MVTDQRRITIKTLRTHATRKSLLAGRKPYLSLRKGRNTTYSNEEIDWRDEKSSS